MNNTVNTAINNSSPLLREALGTVLRAYRLDANRTLRDVADSARVSSGYLSELERGRKEVSSEVLRSICDALGVNLAVVLRRAAYVMGPEEDVTLHAVAQSLFTRQEVTTLAALALLYTNCSVLSEVVLPYKKPVLHPSIGEGVLMRMYGEEK